MHIPEGDVLIHAGDAMRTGYPNEWYALLRWFKSLKHPLKLFIPGNHDFHMQVYPGPALQELREVGVTVIGLPGNSRFETYTLPNGWELLGMPFVIFKGDNGTLPRWAFTSSEEKLQAYLKGKRGFDIIVSHSPVAGMLDRTGSGLSVGVKAYRDWFDGLAAKPKVWINGHIHESYGAAERDGCRFFNVAMCNREYHQVNAPAVIDVSDVVVPRCPDALLPDGPTCPRCGGPRGPSGVDGGSWVHFPR